MKHIKAKILALSIVITGIASAQTIEDINLFNTNSLRGTARYTAMGGAFTALGSDFSAIHINPAAQSVFKEGGIGLSLGFQNLEMTTDFYDQSTVQSDFNFDIENFGLNLPFEADVDRDWSKMAFGTSYNKKAEFNRTYTVEGFNDGLSLSQIWANETASDYIDNYFGTAAYAAWESYLLVSDMQGLVEPEGYAHALESNNDIQYVRQESGAANEFALNFSGQYKTDFYYGLSIGLPSLNYQLEETFNEYGFDVDSIPYDAIGYSYRRENLIDANGINIKLGVIGRLTDWWRIGASFESPTWYTVTQSYNFDNITEFANNDIRESSIYTSGDYRYQLRTPAIYRFGTSFLYEDKALLTFDYTYKNAATNQLSTNSESYNITAADLSIFNDDINNFFTDAHMFSGGAEVNIGPMAFRGGYVYEYSIYKAESPYVGDETTYSGGLAYRAKNFDLELAYSYSTFNQIDPLYASYGGALEESTADNVRTNLILGFNLRF